MAGRGGPAPSTRLATHGPDTGVVRRATLTHWPMASPARTSPAESHWLRAAPMLKVWLALLSALTMPRSW